MGIPKSIHEVWLQIAVVAAVAAAGMAWCAFKKPIIRHDIDDQPFPRQEHRVVWSQYSAATAVVALAVSVLVLHREDGWRRLAAICTMVTAMAVLLGWALFLLSWFQRL